MLLLLLSGENGCPVWRLCAVSSSSSSSSRSRLGEKTQRRIIRVYTASHYSPQQGAPLQVSSLRCESTEAHTHTHTHTHIHTHTHTHTHTQVAAVVLLSPSPSLCLLC